MCTWLIDRKGGKPYNLLMTQKAEALGEELIEELDSLRIEMNRLSECLDASGVERTNGLRQVMGRDCDYYKKSLDLFLRKDYISLRNLTEACHALFERVEGRNPNG